MVALALGCHFLSSQSMLVYSISGINCINSQPNSRDSAQKCRAEATGLKMYICTDKARAICSGKVRMCFPTICNLLQMFLSSTVLKTPALSYLEKDLIHLFYSYNRWHVNCTYWQGIFNKRVTLTCQSSHNCYLKDRKC